MLVAAGYKPVRLAKVEASEDELIDALEGKVEYILGGVEVVAERVIESARDLRVIAFTGPGYTEHIPAYAAASDMGIAISAATGANATAVAEYTVAASGAQSH